jgi:hypothetical protein
VSNALPAVITTLFGLAVYTVARAVAGSFYRRNRRRRDRGR